MGSSEKRGDWLCAPHHVSIAVMGGTELDLRRARFQAAETSITVVAVMGGTDITVPHDVRVINDGVGEQFIARGCFLHLSSCAF